MDFWSTFAGPLGALAGWSVVGLSVALLIIVSYWNAELVLFAPLAPRRKKRLERSPARLGRCYREFVVRSADGVAIRGWRTTGVVRSDVVVVFCHAYDSSKYADLARLEMIPAEIPAVMFDFRGHGDSESAADLTLDGHAQDLEAVLNYATGEYGDCVFVLWGRCSSIGVVTGIAARDRRVRGVVLEGPVQTLWDTVSWDLKQSTRLPAFIFRPGLRLLERKFAGRYGPRTVAASCQQLLDRPILLLVASRHARERRFAQRLAARWPAGMANVLEFPAHHGAIMDITRESSLLQRQLMQASSDLLTRVAQSSDRVDASATPSQDIHDAELQVELQRAVARCLFSRKDWILGEEVAAFETEFAQYLGSPFGVGVSSGSDALFLALRALGIAPGDRVAVPAFTYVATGQAVVRAGAVPVFVDVDPDRWTLNVDGFRRVAPECRAVIPVHPFGRAAPMPDIAEIASRFGILVIEDACQGHGAAINGQLTGTFGDAGCFSFHPTKSLHACGDAGFVCTPHEVVAGRLRRLREPGSNDGAEQEDLRFNHRLDTLQAAILRVRLRAFTRHASRRRAIISQLATRLSPWPVCSGNAPSDVPTELILLAPRRDELRKHLRSRGFHCRFRWTTILPDLPLFAPYLADSRFPVSRLAAKAILGVTIRQDFSDQQVEELGTALVEFMSANRPVACVA